MVVISILVATQILKGCVANMQHGYKYESC